VRSAVIADARTCECQRSKLFPSEIGTAAAIHGIGADEDRERPVARLRVDGFICVIEGDCHRPGVERSAGLQRFNDLGQWHDPEVVVFQVVEVLLEGVGDDAGRCRRILRDMVIEEDPGGSVVFSSSCLRGRCWCLASCLNCRVDACQADS